MQIEDRGCHKSPDIFIARTELPRCVTVATPHLTYRAGSQGNIFLVSKHGSIKLRKQTNGSWNHLMDCVCVGPCFLLEIYAGRYKSRHTGILGYCQQ